MTESLKGKRIAILLTDGVEQTELTEPRKALEKVGCVTEIVSPATGSVQAMKHKEKGDNFKVDVALDSANPDDYDALLLPGGVANPDELRTKPVAVNFVKAIFSAGKPIAAICHGPWLLVEAGVVRGRKVTSWPSLRTDIVNAGGDWTDREVVRDGQLTTSRKPEDIPAFVREMLASFSTSHR